MRAHAVCAAVIFLLALASGARAAVAQPIQISVVEAVFTSEVDGRTRNHKGALGSPAPDGPLSFWTRVCAGAGALEVLRQQGAPPVITHRWSRAVANWEDRRTPEMRHDKDLEIGALDKPAALAGEARCFSWRTWSTKTWTASGQWFVRIVPGRGVALTCDRPDCEYRITLR